MQDLNPSNFEERQFYRISCWTLLTLSLISLALVLIDIPSFSIVVAQQFSSGLSEPVMKVLLNDAITALNNGNTTKTLQNLDVFNQMLTEVKENSSSIQATKLLIQDTLQAIHNGDVSRAIVYLNLVGQQSGIQPPVSEPSNVVITGASNATSLEFLTYEHPILGIIMEYPHAWTVRQYEYNPSANNTLVGFYSPSKTASELGNISGVSGHFVPYSDIFTFDSKNMTLDTIMSERLKRLQNDTHFSAVESKPFTFNDGHPAQVLIYRTIAGGDELFKKMQVYTIYDNKVYLISFTSQDASFSSYMPTVQKMIKTFKINRTNTNSTG
jgi:PsbP-like protein